MELFPPQCTSPALRMDWRHKCRLYNHWIHLSKFIIYIGVIAVPISSPSMPVRGLGWCELQSSEKAVYSRDDPCGRPDNYPIVRVKEVEAPYRLPVPLTRNIWQGTRIFGLPWQ